MDIKGVNKMIEGMLIQPLKKIVDARGCVMHMLRSDSPLFTQFGEVYFSMVNPGIIKGWKRHSRMTQHYAVPIGKIRLVVFDGRESSSTYKMIEILELGGDNYALVRIPPLVWYSFKGIADIASLIANCTDIPHDPAESEQISSDDPRIPYQWETSP